MSIEPQDPSLDGIDDLDAVERADADHPYGQVTAEDLGTDELVYDGAEAETMVPDDADVAVDTALHTDEPGEETIDERLAQEQRDPAAEVAYGETDAETGEPV